MTRAAAVLALAVLLVPAAARAEVSVVVRPEIGLQTGYETFELGFAIPQTSSPYEITGSSELTYPLHTTIGGVAFSLDAESVVWLGSVHTNLHDPWGKMVDSDFLTASLPSSSQSIEFSRTESRATLRMWSAEAALGVRVWRPRPLLRALMLAGFRFESNSYDIFGAKGSHIGEDGEPVAFELPDNLLALEYDTRYRIPFVGARLDGALSDTIYFATEARFLGSFSSHVDDHVLRNKRGRANPFGLGFALAARPTVRLAKSLFLGLDLELQYLHSITGTLSQRYYADDPSLDGDQSQTPIGDAGFSYEYLRGRFLLFAEARL